MANTIGTILKVTSFGESHGPEIGAVIDGLPSGMKVDEVFIQTELNRRKPGQSDITTGRKEEDTFRLISGVFEGRTTGAPITIVIPNKDARPQDYDTLKEIYRPGHADLVYDKKYGHRDYRGGGRSSARITAGWVAAGALASLYLKQVSDIKIESIVSSIYNLRLTKPYSIHNWAEAENNPVRCPDQKLAEEMIKLIGMIRDQGNSVGGTIACRISNVPVGLGDPVFNKLNADLSHAMMSINAAKGIQFGNGFECTQLLGSENNDTINSETNHDGGITGGISNGKPIEFEIAFKPTSSISVSQKMMTRNGSQIEHGIQGRHDPCVLPRAVPIVNALSAIVLADHYLLNLRFLK